MKVVNSTFKITHEAVHVSYCSIGGGVLRDQHQSLTVVLQSLVVLSAETNTTACKAVTLRLNKISSAGACRNVAHISLKECI